MSDAVDFHYIFAPQPLRINSHSIRKQPSASKLINTYLSTAAQYLNRTKSFHISPTAANDHETCQRTMRDSNQSISFKTHADQSSFLTNHLSPARSVPSNINHVNPSSKIHHPHPGSSNTYHEHRFPTNISELQLTDKKKIKDAKSPGLVSTLRRSLRKNKERFYNKRAATMKSCHSLSNYDQSIAVQTPPLLCRRQYVETHSPSIDAVTMKRVQSSMHSVNEHHENESENNDEPMPPLQPLIIDGREHRNRFVTNNGPLSPTASSYRIPTPLGSTTGVSHPTENDQDEKERLKTDLIQLKNELQKSKETIARLQKSEEQMRERLAEQAQRQLEKGGKFEDLNQVARPTELIRSYNSLYSQARIDTLDALDSIREMCDAEDLKSKLLFSVIVLAFRHAQNQARDVRNKIRQILQLTNDKNSIVLEDTIEKYLRTTIQKYDVTKITYEVENQLWTTLYDYPALKACNELLKYITSACRTAWGLVNQTPPYYIEFQTSKYDKLIHERFHTSDNESESIMEYIWPCLIDGRDRTCVAKGVVITDERYLSIAKKIPS